MKRIVCLGLLAMLLCPQRTFAHAGPPTIKGYAAHYSVGTMERAAKIHGIKQQACMAASSYYKLGTQLSVYSSVTRTTQVCVVADTTQARHVALVRSRGIVIELGAKNIGLCGLTYVGEAPPRKCPVVVRPVP